MRDHPTSLSSAGILLASAAFLLLGSSEADAKEISVSSARELTSAYASAAAGDLLILAEGTYDLGSGMTLNKAVTITSCYRATNDAACISGTTLTGSGDALLAIAPSGGGTKIIGVTLDGAGRIDDGIFPEATFEITHSRITGFKDGIDYEDDSGGLCAHNEFFGNRDDGVDIDGDVSVIVEHNLIRDNREEGIEMRLHDYDGGRTLRVDIRHNTITGNGQSGDGDGIQLIDYNGPSNREIYIHHNLIADNNMVGIGMEPDADSDSDFDGSPLEEPVYIYNNTIVGNAAGITGGTNTHVFNNILANHQRTALKDLTARSTADANLFFGNGSDADNVASQGTRGVTGDPLVDSTYRLSAGSPAIDAGLADLPFGVVLSDYEGSAPDLGAYEFGAGGTAGSGETEESPATPPSEGETADSGAQEPAPGTRAEETQEPGVSGDPAAADDSEQPTCDNWNDCVWEPSASEGPSRGQEAGCRMVAGQAGPMRGALPLLLLLALFTLRRALLHKSGRRCS